MRSGAEHVADHRRAGGARHRRGRAAQLLAIGDRRYHRAARARPLSSIFQRNLRRRHGSGAGGGWLVRRPSELALGILDQSAAGHRRLRPVPACLAAVTGASFAAAHRLFRRPVADRGGELLAVRSVLGWPAIALDLAVDGSPDCGRLGADGAAGIAGNAGCGADSAAPLVFQSRRSPSVAGEFRHHHGAARDQHSHAELPATGAWRQRRPLRRHDFADDGRHRDRFFQFRPHYAPHGTLSAGRVDGDLRRRRRAIAACLRGPIVVVAGHPRHDGAGRAGFRPDLSGDDGGGPERRRVARHRHRYVHDRVFPHPGRLVRNRDSVGDPDRRSIPGIGVGARGRAGQRDPRPFRRHRGLAGRRARGGRAGARSFLSPRVSNQRRRLRGCRPVACDHAGKAAARRIGILRFANARRNNPICARLDRWTSSSAIP